MKASSSSSSGGSSGGSSSSSSSSKCKRMEEERKGLRGTEMQDKLNLQYLIEYEKKIICQAGWIFTQDFQA